MLSLCHRWCQCSPRSACDSQSPLALAACGPSQKWPFSAGLALLAKILTTSSEGVCADELLLADSTSKPVAPQKSVAMCGYEYEYHLSDTVAKSTDFPHILTYWWLWGNYSFYWADAYYD